MSFSKFGGTFALLASGCFVIPATMQAAGGTVILEGSDAIGYHCPQASEPGACTYTAQVWKALDGSSGKPIAVIGDSSVTAITSQGSGVTIDDFQSVAAAGTLSQYAALYFEAGGGCCAENDALITATGATAAVTAYLNAGGTVMIENYIGGTAWDFAVGAGGLGNSNSNTVGASAADTSFTCSDGETVTTLGLANGFTQPPAIECWEHQAYRESFFGGLTSINGKGFTQIFFNADPSGCTGCSGYAALLSNGSTLSAPATTPLPPTSWLTLFGLTSIAVFLAARGKFSRAS